ncbi:MAG: hypothetical protein WCC90_09385, partial [Methylocella sp.]
PSILMPTVANATPHANGISLQSAFIWRMSDKTAPSYVAVAQPCENVGFMLHLAAFEGRLL